MTTSTTLMKPTRAASSPLKRSLRSASRKAVVNEDVALLNEEERMLHHDEEITSEEDVGEGDDAVEETMFTVALVNSVVETRKTSSDLPAKTEGSPKYGLRKRRRPSQVPLEHEPQSTGDVDMGNHNGSQLKLQDTSVSSSIPATKELETPSTDDGNFSSIGQVPNPLSKPLPPIPVTSKAVSVDQSKSVPCPLHPSSKEEKDDTENDKRKVNFTESVEPRPRGFSIDMDSVGLDFPDDTSAAGASDLPPSRRDRAFSFECFAFGISADEPLPPFEQSLSTTTTARPRGDSIIFDPSSFQEGGIHEQSALKNCSSDKKNVVAPVSTTSSTHPGANLLPLIPPQVYSSQPIPNHTGSSGAMNPNAGGGSFSPELLNKDGRIGIYLPDARRARIARFHAKRAKRIWRKRIKYDCRKKLADSRPRIKGRFVKRVDMDDE